MWLHVVGSQVALGCKKHLNVLGLDVGLKSHEVRGLDLIRLFPQTETVQVFRGAMQNRRTFRLL